jgi:hypothetical protein
MAMSAAEVQEQALSWLRRSREERCCPTLGGSEWSNVSGA